MSEKDKAGKNGGMLELLLKAAGAFGSVATGNGLPAPDDIKIVGTKDLPEGALVGSQKTPAVQPVYTPNFQHSTQAGKHESQR